MLAYHSAVRLLDDARAKERAHAAFEALGRPLAKISLELPCPKRGKV